MPTEEELQRGFNLGEWEVLPGKGVLRRGEQEERPEPKVFAVLLALAKRGSNLVTKQELIDEVWEGRPTSDEPIARCLSQLRGHLDDRQKPHKYIDTLQRRGYRLKQSVELHQPAEPDETTTAVTEPGPSLRLWRIVAAILAVGFVAIVAFTWLRPIDQPVRSIAVMPFENLSGAVTDEYLVSGFKEELVQTLHRINDFTVKNGRVDYEKELPEIAELLQVESVLFGTLRRDGDELKISYQISTSAEGVVHSGDIEGNVDELFDLQEALAVMVRDNLVGESTQTLIKSRPSDSVAYDSYIRGMYLLEHRGTKGNIEKGIELFKKAIFLDAQYGPSYLGLATLYALAPTYLGLPTEEMHRDALQTINAGIAADPNLEVAGSFIWGYIYHMEKSWDEAEKAYQRAISADVIDSNAFNWYSRMLASVGRLDSSLELALAGLELDPGSPSLNSRVAMSYAWLHENELALEYFERANDLDWNGSTHILGYAFMLVQDEQFEKAQNLAMATAAAENQSSSWVAPVFAAIADRTNAKAQAAIEALDEAAELQQVPLFVEVTLRGILGDVEGAMRIAKLLEKPGEAFEMDLLFIPELAGLRQHPDFKPLMERIGIKDYWDDNGCVWIDDRVNCPKN